MPRTLEQIDRQSAFEIWPYQRDLDRAHYTPVQDAVPIVLDGDDVAHLLEWAGRPTWRSAWEADLQCLANDAAGHRR